MMDNIDSENRSLLELLYSLTVDQLATAHLLIAHAQQLQFVLVSKRARSPQLGTYIKSVTSFLKRMQQKSTSEISGYYGSLATFDLVKLLNATPKYVFSADSVYNWTAIVRVIKRLLTDYYSVFGNKTFGEYFNDLTFPICRIFSRKASNLLMHNLYEEEYNTLEQIEEEGLEEKTTLMDCFIKSWFGQCRRYGSLSTQKVLIFNSFSIMLCRSFLDIRLYAKYYKLFSKTVKGYKRVKGMRKKKNSINTLKKESYPRLKSLIFDLLEKGYERKDPLLHQYELFTLATDLFLDKVAMIDEEEARQMVLKFRKNKNGVYTSDTINEFVQTYTLAAEEEFKRLVAELQVKEISDGKVKESQKDLQDKAHTRDFLNDANLLPELIRDADFDKKSLVQSLKKPLRKLSKLDSNQALQFHSVAICILSERCIPFEPYNEQYNIYDLSVKQAFSAYRNCEESPFVESYLQNADKDFKKMFDVILKQLTNVTPSTRVNSAFMPLLATAKALIEALEDVAKMDAKHTVQFLKEWKHNSESNIKSRKSLQALLLKYRILTNKKVKEMFLIKLLSSKIG